MEWDEKQEFPLHIFKEMGKLGLMGIFVPEQYGGSGMGILSTVQLYRSGQSMWFPMVYPYTIHYAPAIF